MYNDTMQSAYVGSLVTILILHVICWFHILLIRLQWCTQAFSLLSMFDCFKYHQAASWTSLQFNLYLSALMQSPLHSSALLQHLLYFCIQVQIVINVSNVKYHQPLLGLPSTALLQGCLDCRNILNAWTVGEFFFWG